MINDALVLRTYNDMDSALAVPISPSAAWAFPETAGNHTVRVLPYSPVQYFCVRSSYSALGGSLFCVSYLMQPSRKFYLAYTVSCCHYPTRTAHAEVYVD